MIDRSDWWTDQHPCPYGYWEPQGRWDCRRFRICVYCNPDLREAEAERRRQRWRIAAQEALFPHVLLLLFAVVLAWVGRDEVFAYFLAAVFAAAAIANGVSSFEANMPEPRRRQAPHHDADDH